MAEDFSGFVLLDKPVGMTSFQVLFPVKKRFSTKRVGHAGTLDQQATGLMISAVGKCTRLLDEVEALSKLYTFRLHLGKQTDTLEWVGETVFEDANAARTWNDLLQVIPDFVGVIEQTPPAYSAIKIDGKRASDHMRAGNEVEMKSRKIEIYSLKPLNNNIDSSELCQEFDLICHCTKGTYIRSLGRDLALKMGTYGCVSQIRRLAIGNILVEQGQNPNERDMLQLIPAEKLLPWPCLEISETELADIRQGRALYIRESSRFHWNEDQLKMSDGRLFVRYDGAARAVCYLEGIRLRPEVQIA